MTNTLMVFLFLLSFFGCSSQSTEKQQNDKTFPAVIHTPSAESLQEVQETVAKLLKQQKIYLAADVFTKSNILTLERKKHQSINKPVISGREIAKPLYFDLFIETDNCFVRNKDTGTKIKLKLTQCKVLNK